DALGQLDTVARGRPPFDGAQDLRSIVIGGGGGGDADGPSVGKRAAEPGGRLHLRGASPGAPDAGEVASPSARGCSPRIPPRPLPGRTGPSRRWRVWGSRAPRSG